MYQGLGNRHVVGAVLLRRADRDRDRDRPLYPDAPEDGADEAGDPLVARESRLVLVGALPEEAARLEEQAVERLRVAAMGVEHREAAEARAHADALPVRDSFCDRGQELAHERARIERARGIRLVAVDRLDQRRPQRRYALLPAHRV